MFKGFDLCCDLLENYYLCSINNSAIDGQIFLIRL